MVREYGYTGRILRVDLSSGHISETPTADYAEPFIGGMGLASRVYWDEVSPEITAFDPENRLLFVTGPLAGFTGIAGSMWQVHGKSPLTIPEQFCYGNLGGSWGAQLKFAGYDGIVIKGKLEKPGYILIEDAKAHIREIPNLWGTGALEARRALKRELGATARVATIGQAGENKVAFANVIADNDSSASAGMGAIMGSKNLKAVVVRGRQRPVAAHPQKLKELARQLRQMRQGAEMADFGLIPGPNMKKQLCYGCINGCIRATMRTSRGDVAKYMCQSAIFYQFRAYRYYGEWNEVPFYANRICDQYGVDTRVVESMLAWLIRCYRDGILTEENSGLPFSKFGSMEFIESLIKETALREGFGDVLARGLLPAAEAVGKGSKELFEDYIIHTTGQSYEGDPRTDTMAGLLHAMQPREHAAISPISGAVSKWREWIKGTENAYMTTDVLQAISRRFFDDESVVDYSEDTGKGQAVKKTQDRWSARESLILCGFTYPITDVADTDEHTGDPTLESQVFSAVTGKEVDEEELNRKGEVIFNLRRAIFAREGRQGRGSEVLPDIFYTQPFRERVNPEDPYLMPGKDGEPVAKKGAMVERDRFEKVKDEYYLARGWDVATGLQTKSKLEALGLREVAEDLKKRGLAL